jgi:hypothetical protein
MVAGVVMDSNGKWSGSAAGGPAEEELLDVGAVDAAVAVDVGGVGGRTVTPDSATVRP